MGTTTATYTPNAYPNGRADFLDKRVHFGTVAIGSGGTYITNGLPISIVGQFYEGANPFWGDLYSPANAASYTFDPTNQTIRISVANVELSSGSSVTADTVQAMFITIRT